MRFTQLYLAIGVLLAPTTLAQTSSNGAAPSITPSNSTKTNGTQQVITTTLTSLVAGPSGGASSTSLLTLTLTLASSGNGNSTLSNGTTILANGTRIAANGTMTAANGTVITNNGTVPWNETDQWLPFHIVIDPAYGILGGLLIFSGIPVAALGGKNRWSSLAIVSGYCLMLFTLVMILRFGVEPSFQPPSPSPPSRTLRGLYLLACIISAFIGAGLGIFLFNLARYFVAAAGGFAFGWFLLETRSGGLIQSVVGRWGLLGGLTVGALLASIAPKMIEPMMLASTAWIGATAFVFGVDCYTRAGLKEFYVYNLGFHDLFPSLNGEKYPLTQTMAIELGILAAVALVGCAIQARVLNCLQRHVKQMRDEEEMRIEAEEVAKAADRFINVGIEREEWEEKHGNSSTGMRHSESGRLASAGLPILNHSQPKGYSSTPSLSLPPIDENGRGQYDSVSMVSPGIRASSDMGTPLTDRFTLKDDSGPRKSTSIPTSPALTDSDLESKLRLLDKVRKARESIRGSINDLHRETPSLSGRLDPEASRSVTPTLSINADSMHSRHLSIESSRVLDPSDLGRTRRHSSASNQRLLTSSGPNTPREDQTQTPSNEWDQYVSDRRILAPSITSPTTPVEHAKRYSQYTTVSGSVAKALDRRDRTTSMFDFPSNITTQPMSCGSSYRAGRTPRTASMLEPGMNSQAPFRLLPSSKGRESTERPASVRRTSSQDMSAPPCVITGSAAGKGGHNTRPRPMQRTMTYDELSDRHSKRLSALQGPVTARMKEQEVLRLARERWERQKRHERAQMERREKEGLNREVTLDKRVMERVEEKEEVLKNTEDWRKSVRAGFDGYGLDSDRRSVRGPSNGGGKERRMSSVLIN